MTKTKKEKAMNIVDRLTDKTNNWIEYDVTPVGKIAFIIKGLGRTVEIPTSKTANEATITIARYVTQAGLDYGYCSLILQREKEEEELNREFLDNLSKTMTQAFDTQNDNRIRNLTESEILMEIQVKYGIKVTSYEKVNRDNKT